MARRPQGINSNSMSAEARQLPVTLLLSFEAGEQVTDMRVYLPDDVEAELISAKYEVVKQLANTNAGTIDIKDSAGALVATQLSIPLSSPLGTRGDFSLAASADNEIRRRITPSRGRSYLTITTAKGAAGGKVQVQLMFEKLRKGYDR